MQEARKPGNRVEKSDEKKGGKGSIEMEAGRARVDSSNIGARYCKTQHRKQRKECLGGVSLTCKETRDETGSGGHKLF